MNHQTFFMGTRKLFLGTIPSCGDRDGASLAHPWRIAARMWRSRGAAFRTIGNMTTKIGIHGAAGRMGRAIIGAALERDDCAIGAALVRPGSAREGEQLARQFGEHAPDLEYAAALDPDAKLDVMIDFSCCAAFDAALALALDRRVALVTGTTGLTPAQSIALKDAGGRIPVLWAANFSLGVALLRRLAATAAAALGEEFDVEIVEAHHRNKQDAPSGTALVLGRAVADARRRSLEDVARYARHGQTGARASGEIGFAVIRAADIVGEHTVLFAAPGERIELTHRASSRDVFAHGAVRAAIWLAKQEPGVYDIADVLG
jgi:4-hydroxy-tetrahydrodipicolinate reductase